MIFYIVIFLSFFIQLDGVNSKISIITKAVSRSSIFERNLPKAIPATIEKKVFNFSQEPIDVIIPAVEKDLRTLELCIQGIRTYGNNIRRIIVVSAKQFTDSAEWFDENNYPFTKYDVMFQILKNHTKATDYLASPKNKAGWIYQQLLKLYAPLVIPNISSNVLVLDSDTIFLNTVTFIDEYGAGLYNPDCDFFHRPYFAHGKRLIPGFSKLFSQLSGVSHHMLLQQEVLMDLFEFVEQVHQTQFWRAFCNCIDPSQVPGACASEYELYFNFLFARTDQCKIRSLKWKNMPFETNLKPYHDSGYHYVSCHTYLG